MTGSEELELHRRLERFRDQLRPIPEVGKVLSFAIRFAREAFAADGACVAVKRRAGPTELRAAHPRGDGFDLALLGGFIANQRPAVPPDLLLAPVRRRGRAWGVLALSRGGKPFADGAGRMLGRFAAAVSETLERIDREHLLEVRSRIDRKVMEQLRPKDLFYQVLHGLRSMTRYDHSSALLIGEKDGHALTLVAEQIAWTKAKSRKVGLRVALDDAARAEIDPEVVYGFERSGEDWQEWSGAASPGLARQLDYNREQEGPRESALLVAPFLTREGVIAVLKIAGQQPSSFSRHDAEVVAGFVPQAALAIDNSRRTESLELRLLQAERKHAMANLARGVSHDVNNALGAVLPLVQQLRADAAAGGTDPAELAADLAQIERSLQVVRRIFGGMLALARGGVRRPTPGAVPRALDNVLAILGDGMTRRGVRIDTRLAPGLPLVALSQGDLDQVLLNLLSNARDAMPDGGVLTVAAARAGAVVEVTVADTGCGIPADDLGRVAEPFFTTKPEGGGLGLTVCRSILWEADGSLDIDSAPGTGTRVTVRLPVAAGGPPS